MNDNSQSCQIVHGPEVHCSFKTAMFWVSQYVAIVAHLNIALLSEQMLKPYQELALPVEMGLERELTLLPDGDVGQFL